MLLVYHLQTGNFVWSLTSNAIDDSEKFGSDFLFEKTGLRIDQPTSDGVTTSTGNNDLAIIMSLFSTFRR